MDHKEKVVEIFQVASFLEDLELAQFLTDFENIDFGPVVPTIARSNPRFIREVAYTLGEAQGKIRKAYGLLGFAETDFVAQQSVAANKAGAEYCVTAEGDLA
jgi:hypothetical protein